MRENDLPKKLTVFVVDDEAGPLKTLADDLSQLPEVGDVHTFSSYTEATFPLLELQPDVVFLDIEVPGKSGLDFLQSIRPRLSFTFHAVFYTGHSNYLLDALRNSAFDFLLKPYTKEELKGIIDRILEMPASPVHQIGRPMAGLENGGPRKLALQTISELLLVSVGEVLMVQYDRITRSWVLTLTDSSVHRLHAGVTATDLVAMAPSTLIRISSSCIVNLNYLVAIENATQRCRFCAPFSGIELFASRRYYSRLKERFELL